MPVVDLTRLPASDPTRVYRYRDGLYAADLLTAAIVHLDAPARIGSLVDVRIEHAGPFSLRGMPADALVMA